MSLNFSDSKVKKFIELKLGEGFAPLGNKRDVFEQVCRTQGYSFNPERFDYREFLATRYRFIQANTTLNVRLLAQWRDVFREVRSSLEEAERFFAS